MVRDDEPLLPVDDEDEDEDEAGAASAAAPGIRLVAPPPPVLPPELHELGLDVATAWCALRTTEGTDRWDRFVAYARGLGLTVPDVIAGLPSTSEIEEWAFTRLRDSKVNRNP